MSEKIKLSELVAARAAMPMGHVKLTSAEYPNGEAGIFDPEDTTVAVVIAAADAAGMVATLNSANPLIEVVQALFALEAAGQQASGARRNWEKARDAESAGLNRRGRVSSEAFRMASAASPRAIYERACDEAKDARTRFEAARARFEP